MERGELLKEYESIPRRHPAGECSVAQQPESADKNRFQDVLPYDNTRVELVPTKENNTGYINASHIKVSSAVMFHNPREDERCLFSKDSSLLDVKSDVVLMQQMLIPCSVLTLPETYKF